MLNEYMNKNRRPQASKRVRNEAMGEAFRELRKSSAAQPHRNRSKYNRNDYKIQSRRGDW